MFPGNEFVVKLSTYKMVLFLENNIPLAEHRTFRYNTDPLELLYNIRCLSDLH
jgi:hypothetical protein